MMTFVRAESDAYTITVSSADISTIANEVRSVPREYINADGNNITEACLKYLAPLILGEVDIEYENGMPKHIVI